MAVELAIGFFDGVHLGHRKIISAAKARGGETVVETFLSHPMEVVSPDRAPKLIMTPEMRRRALFEAGADRVEMREFTRETAAMTPEEYAEILISRHPSLDTVFCGANWTFGAKGAGTPWLLKELLAGKASVEVVGYAMVDGIPVSSSRIREALSVGRIDEADRLLGHGFEIEGPVVKGKGLGRDLGYPTINLEVSAPALPFGVYLVKTPFGKAIANWGHAPTAGDMSWKKPILEIHLLEHGFSPLCASAPLRDKNTPPCETMRIEVAEFIRLERKFSSFDELKEQIKRDIEYVKKA